MPNPLLTPGAIQSSDTAAICTPGWASAHRDVSTETKDAVAAAYGLSSRSGYEIDHLIPLELGGANTTANLWPEPYGSPFGATEKDGLEDFLHARVCDGGLALATAQHEIAANWYAAWLAAGKPMPSDFGYSDSPPGGTPAPGTTATTPSTTAAAGAPLCGAPSNPFGYNFCGRGSLITSPNPNTCSYFTCIHNFSNGTGYMIQCNDGTYSMSGGHSGACNYHHGAGRPVYSGS